MKSILYWFKDSSKMKRWIMLILVGVVFSSYGMASLIVSNEAISFVHAIKIIIYFVIGFTCVVMGLIFINKRTMELFVEATDDRLDSGKKVNVNSLIFNKKIYNKGPKIVVIGGGSGLNTTLEGLKKHTSKAKIQSASKGSTTSSTSVSPTNFQKAFGTKRNLAEKSAIFLYNYLHKPIIKCYNLDKSGNRLFLIRS